FSLLLLRSTLYRLISSLCSPFPFVFIFTYRPPSFIYTLSLHDALPISKAHKAERRDGRRNQRNGQALEAFGRVGVFHALTHTAEDRKSTRLNSSHVSISYAVFCLKKKKCSA